MAYSWPQAKTNIEGYFKGVSLRDEDYILIQDNLF